jgi:hypothetical protein
MDTWNYLEYARLGPLGPVRGAVHVLDWLKHRPQLFSEDLLTSSREGEMEATQEEAQALGGNMAMAQPAAQAPQKISLLRVLGPAHVWALGVGIVLVGEYMGWNFSVGKGRHDRRR